MPFPLAHPAAVLPLRRYCARWLNFPALVIGSMVPDVGYVLHNDYVSGFSHEVLGSIGFGLPVGFLMLAIFYNLRVPIAEMLPDPTRRLFVMRCDRPMGPLWLAAVSLVIGLFTHVFWDAFTHNDGWIAAHVPLLLIPVMSFAGHTARVSNVLWYVSTFAGVGWILFSYEKWKWSAGPQRRPFPATSLLKYAIPLTVLVILVSLVRHLIRGDIGFILTAVLCTLLVILFALRMTRTRRGIAK